MPEGEAIEHPWVTRAIENAQRKVEGRNFDIRKQLLEFDDVSNDQRKVIYQQRNELLEATDVAETIQAMRHDVVVQLFANHIPSGSLEEEWNIPALEAEIATELGLQMPLQQMLEEQPDLHEETLLTRVQDAVEARYLAKEQQVGAEGMRHFERAVMLQILDTHWREHLAALDHLRQGIHLRSYAQKNPKQEYKREAFELFSSMLSTVKAEVTRITMLVQIRDEAEIQAVEKPANLDNVRYQHADFEEALANTEDRHEVPLMPAHRDGMKVGRNDTCPCGSGKKYKHCHGKLA
jgi:preprotein translocase subunit SecA